MTRTGWLTVALTTAVLALPVVGYLYGRSRALSQVAASIARADSVNAGLRAQLAGTVATVVRDTLVRDSLVIKWRDAKLRIDTLRDTAFVPVVEVRTIVQQADTTIARIEQQHRVCAVGLLDCQSLAAKEKQRADQAEALMAARSADARRASQWRAVERGACAASLAGNVLQWSVR